jgi:uncharacterized protein (TIGR03118 family)
MSRSRIFVIVSLAVLVSAAHGWAGSVGFVQTNLVSNVPGLAAATDPDLVNPWGLSFSPASPFWVANNGTGRSTLYNGAGVKQGLVVTIPPAPGSPAGTTSTPTGTVFNPTSTNFTGDRFLFATQDGTIAGWQGSLGTTAAIRYNSPTGAEYTGLAIAGDRIFAADLANGRVDVFDSSYSLLSIGGAFTDPNLPANYVPFGIQTIGGSVFVAFANKLPGSDEENPGAGLGFVDEFDTNGNLIRRVVSDGALNAPWAIALAPASFGNFGGALLVGNFGDGRINAFDPTTGALLGGLLDPIGNPIEIEGLWGLAFGNAGPGFSPNKLYFAAGIDDEENGLFGSLEAVPEPGTLWLLGSAGTWLVARRRRRP